MPRTLKVRPPACESPSCYKYTSNQCRCQGCWGCQSAYLKQRYATKRRIQMNNPKLAKLRVLFAQADVVLDSIQVSNDEVYTLKVML